MSLAILLALFVAQFVLLVVASTLLARRLRAKHATWRRGGAVSAAIVALNLLTMLALLVPARLPAVQTMATAFALVAFLTVSFLLLRRGFGLPGGRTAAVLGVVVLCFVGVTVLSVTVVKPHAVEAFVVPTNSMSPTVQSGDHLTAQKLLKPQRWDCVVYRSTASGQVFCKRLAGLPGDRLRFDGGDLYINDAKATPPPALAGRLRASNGVVPGLYHDGQTITLSADELFLLGDNVDVSLDSRYEGPSQRDSLIGVIDFRYWPVHRIGFVQ